MVGGALNSVVNVLLTYYLILSKTKIKTTRTAAPIGQCEVSGKKQGRNGLLVTVPDTFLLIYNID